MSMRTGTCNYVSLAHLKSAYGSEYKSALDEGRVIIGRPQIKSGESLLVDGDGRYHIVEAETQA